MTWHNQYVYYDQSTGAGISEEDHSALDHAALDGIPAIDGLLNEANHDALDHTGVTGVPPVAISGGIWTISKSGSNQTLTMDGNDLITFDATNIDS